MIIELINSQLISLLQSPIAIAVGVLPVLVWLWFLEHEDLHPEPKMFTIYAFLAGMAAVIAAISIEFWVNIQGAALITITIVIAPVVEELSKFFAAGITVLWRKDNDEPIDSMMYMIVVALGFAALENAFFILNPIQSGGSVVDIIHRGDFRFIGATLLHVVASTIIGISMALSFYKSRAVKTLYIIIGVMLAILLHIIFNFLIILDDGSKSILAFYTIWTVFVGILLFFEKVKRLRRSNRT